MRKGNRVEKFDGKKNVYFNHRVIIPICIPSNEGYYRDLVKILKVHLASVFQNVDPSITKITLIDNDSIDEVRILLLDYYKQGIVDKLVTYNQNQGKVLALLSEIRASCEEFITFTDCDILLRQGIFRETFEIFQSSSKIGAVSPFPLPHTSHIATLSTLLDNIFRIRTKQWDPETVAAFNTFGIDTDRYKEQLHTKRLVVKKNGKLMCVGAPHVICTVRKSSFQSYFQSKPEYVFGYKMDKIFLDRPVDLYGYWRVSTTNFFAWHMGNNYSTEYEEYLDQINLLDYELPNLPQRRSRIRNMFPQNSDKISFAIRKLLINWRL